MDAGNDAVTTAAAAPDPKLEKGWKEIEKLEKRVHELESQLARAKSLAPTSVPRPMAMWMLDHWHRNNLSDAWLIDHLLGLAPAPRSMQLRYGVVSRDAALSEVKPKARTFSSFGEAYTDHIALTAEGVIDACAAHDVRAKEPA